MSFWCWCARVCESVLLVLVRESVRECPSGAGAVECQRVSFWCWCARVSESVLLVLVRESVRECPSGAGARECQRVSFWCWCGRVSESVLLVLVRESVGDQSEIRLERDLTRTITPSCVCFFWGALAEPLPPEIAISGHLGRSRASLRVGHPSHQLRRKEHAAYSVDGAGSVTSPPLHPPRGARRRSGRRTRESQTTPCATTPRWRRSTPLPTA